MKTGFVRADQPCIVCDEPHDVVADSTDPPTVCGGCMGDALSNLHAQQSPEPARTWCGITHRSIGAMPLMATSWNSVTCDRCVAAHTSDPPFGLAVNLRRLSVAVGVLATNVESHEPIDGELVDRVRDLLNELKEPGP